MSIEPTYRLDLKSQDIRDLAALVGIDQPTMFMILDELRTHWTVDTRLQDIADAWNAYRNAPLLEAGSKQIKFHTLLLETFTEEGD